MGIPVGSTRTLTKDLRFRVALRRDHGGYADKLALIIFVSLTSACAGCSGCGATEERPPSVGATTEPTPEHDGSAAPDGAGGPDGPAAPALEGKLQTQNSAGRSGSFYLPAGYNTAAVPMLVAYHGTGGSGSDMVAVFRAHAATSRFLVVAPDSRRSPSGDWTWEVGDKPGEVTEDYTHTLDCIAEVRAMPGVTVDAARVLVLGYSGGGSSAPYIGSNESVFRAFGVLHGGVVQGGIGGNVIRGWFSTGADDSARPPSLVQQSVDYMKGLGFTDLVFKSYPGGHELGEPEVGDVIGWWLGG